MKISYNWLCEYLPLEKTANEVADILTSIGLEVEETILVESVRGGLKDLVVGHVLELEKHADADKLKVATVDAGTGKILQIVCGAPNVAAGQKVVVALDGTMVYPVNAEPFKIKKSKIRGVVSEGMLCAEDEIGLSTNHAGLLVLPNDAVVGTRVAELFNIKTDYVFEIGLTPNRSDAMSHLGVARDICAWLNVHEKKNIALHFPEISEEKNADEIVQVQIENKTKCLRYSGVVISDLKISESPDWIKNKLHSIGLKPVNNVVDVTNLVMHECGQPLHAFDIDAIEGKKIIVKTVANETSFTTLDGKEIKLNQDDLMICDATKPLCIAGVYGGLNSGVKENTATVFLESASFQNTTVRRSAGRHILRTDAAMRFEKGTDVEMTIAALMRAAFLLKEIAGGKISSTLIDIYPEPKPATEIFLSYKKLNDLCGMEIHAENADTILQSLQFEKLKTEKDGAVWKVPSFKQDVIKDVDLIEEILRIYGYEKIPFASELKMSLPSKIILNAEGLAEKISAMLSSNGFNELMINSITNSTIESKLFPDLQNQQAKLLSFANSGLDALRISTVTGGLQSMAYNLNRQQHDLFFYESGKTFLKQGNVITETLHLSIFACGNFNTDHWQQKTMKTDLFFMKGITESIAHKLGIRKIKWQQATELNLDSALQLTSGKFILANLGKLSEALLKQFDIKAEVYYADLLVENFLQAMNKAEIKFKEISKFPVVKRDLALVINQQIPFELIKEISNKNGGSYLQNISLFDVFTNEKLGTDKKSYAVSFTFSNDQKTLTDADVDEAMNKLIASFEREAGAMIRK